MTHATRAEFNRKRAEFLPYRVERSAIDSTIRIYDRNGGLAASAYNDIEAQFIVDAANAYDDLMRALTSISLDERDTTSNAADKVQSMARTARAALTKHLKLA